MIPYRPLMRRIPYTRLERFHDGRVQFHHEEWGVGSRSKTIEKSDMTSKCLYKIKCVADGSIKKYKARFVRMGSSIRAVISAVAEMGWKIHQMDVKTAFLNGLL